MRGVDPQTEGVLDVWPTAIHLFLLARSTSTFRGRLGGEPHDVRLRDWNVADGRGAAATALTDRCGRGTRSCPGLGSTSRRSRVGIARGSAYSYASSGTGNAAGQSGVVRRSRVRHRLPPTTRPLTCTGGLRSRTAHVSSPCDGTFRQGSTAVERAAHRRSRRRSRRVRGQDSPLHHRRHGRHPDDDAPAQQTPGPHSEQARPHTACS